MKINRNANANSYLCCKHPLSQHLRIAEIYSWVVNLLRSIISQWVRSNAVRNDNTFFCQFCQSFAAQGQHGQECTGANCGQGKRSNWVCSNKRFGVENGHSQKCVGTWSTRSSEFIEYNWVNNDSHHQAGHRTERARCSAEPPSSVSPPARSPGGGS